MAKKLVNRGSSANDGSGDNLRVGAGKINDNFDEIYTAFGDGSTLTSGTFITTTSTSVVSNKSLALGSNTVTGTTAQFNTALTDGSFATLAGTEVLTNKSIDSDNNTITNIVNADIKSSAAIANSKLANSTVSYGGVSLALGATDATPAFDLADATNYPTTSLSGTITNAQLAGSIANSKLSNNSINIIADDSSAQSVALGGSILFTGGSGITTSISGNEISFVTDGSIVTETSSDTLTNKTINGPDNTLTNIANSSLANNGVTIGADTIALGATQTTITDLNLDGTSSLSGTGGVDTTSSGNKLRFNFTNLASLPTAATYEGMFAYDIDGNNPYVADAGGWVKLLSENSSVADLSNVNISGIANGNALIWNSSSARFEAGAQGAGFSAGSDLDQAGADIVDLGYISHRSPDATVTQTLLATVVTKTTEHTAYGDGSSSGYAIDGHEGAHLQLSPGVYKFDQADSSNSGHPLLFYDTAGKTTLYSTGVTTSGTPGSAGAHTTITITKDTPSTLHYQCSAHANMGGVLSVVGSENPHVDNLGVGLLTAVPPSGYGGVHIHSQYPAMKLSATATGSTATDGFVARIDSTPRVELWNFENSDMVFANNNAEAMRITSAGDLSIGSTTTDEQLHVKGRRGLTRPAGGHRVIEFYTNITASTSAADLFTATCTNSHSSFYYEIIVNGADWSGHSAARTIKRGFHVPNTTYTEHSVVESSGTHASDITYSYSRSGNTFTGKLTLDTGGVGLNCYVKLVGMISAYTVAGTE